MRFRFNRLYTKFLSFLAVLAIAEVLVLVLFVMVPAKHFGARLETLLKSKAQIVKGVVEDKIRSAPDVSWSKNERLKTFITDFSALLGTKVWLTDANGVAAVKSFPGDIPDVTKEIPSGPGWHKDFKIRLRTHLHYYHAVIPIELSGKQAGDLHVLLDTQPFPQPTGYFLLGFLVLALTIALLIIPVSRLMTTRLKRLQQSAIRITEGDLSHRARIAGNDEISELSSAFNGMTDKLESMILNAKELTANVSHELRSPLTRIRLIEEMLREKLSSNNVQAWAGHLDAIREEVDELDVLIGRMLELSKLDMYEAPMRFEPLDPSELIQGLLEKLLPAVERKGVRLETVLVYDPPFVADRETLRSALINVLDNSIKFVPQEGEISVRMEWLPESLEVRVTNAFEKLSEEDLGLIFDPFQRKKGTAAIGHGLGLTIARKAIERHGGAIKARNAEKGFEITISLPRAAGAQDSKGNTVSISFPSTTVH